MKAITMMELEIGLYDWSALPCRRCPSADHVPGDLLRMAGAQTLEEAEPRGIDFHVIQDSWTTRTAVPVARVLMAGLADRSISAVARNRFLDLLWSFVIVDDEDIAAECLDAVRGGIWALYEEILSGDSKGSALLAYWLVKDAETTPARVDRLLATARHRLPEDLYEED
ncbi:hypothetical protein [Streptomyces bacillaris]|uniref:hypothetical protein n=1 Tax=Streptomyces bacillaris TaxID=68179 RepID=UPI001135F5CA|nr:hypothetical protein EQG64_19265 [Streptomyces sp. S6]